MLSDPSSVSFSSEPILNAITSYQGSITDLDRGEVTDGGTFQLGLEWLIRDLRTKGLRSSDRIVVAIGNGPMFPATLASILALDGMPLLVHVDSPPAELVRVAERFDASFIICDAHDEKDFVDLSENVTRFDDDGWVRGSWVELSNTRSSVEVAYPKLSGVPLHPTSGTTGQPKLAIRPALAAVAEASHYIDTLGIEKQDTILCVVPMSHAYGFGMCNMVAMLSGANLVCMRRFHPKIAARALESQRITTFPAVPVMLDVLPLAIQEPLDPPPRHVLSAGAPLADRTATQFKERFGVAVGSLYGTTETGGISIASSDDGPIAVGCVGKPMTGVEAQIRPVAGADGLDEEVGRLFIKSTSLMAGYLQRGNIDTAPLSGGWFETGDLAWLDKDGSIHLKGREKEVINVFGMKVVPLEVEEVVSMLPNVQDVKVYPGTHASGSQIVKIAVVGDGSLDVSGVRKHCEKHLAPYKQPEVVTLLPQLPRTSLGKIILDQLP